LILGHGAQLGHIARLNRLIFSSRFDLAVPATGPHAVARLHSSSNLSGQPRSFEMRRTVTLFAATTLSLSSASSLAAPAAPGSISPHHATGQQVPPLECEDAGENPAPSQSGREPGPGSPFQEDSISGAHYAGEQDGINNKNTASVSQYDIACFKGPEQ
jgi:hypothetical protein